MRSDIRERGNDNFRILVIQPNNFKILVSRGFIKEIGNICFLYNQETDLWTLVNSDFHYVTIPTKIYNNRLWYIGQTKNKLLSGGRKMSRKSEVNVIEIASDQVNSLFNQIINLDESFDFQALYNKLQPQLNLPPYNLPDKKKD